MILQLVCCMIVAAKQVTSIRNEVSMASCY